MRIIQKYININLISLTLLALFALVALFSFFSIIDQLEETGRGNYGVLQALFYVLLTTPRLSYELFPIAAVIGSMTALGMFAQNSELAVIRTSGVSKFHLAYVFFKSGIILVVIAILIGELIAPKSEEIAQQLRSMALTEQITLKTKYGFWARDGNSYVNIRRVLPNDRVEEIYIYEFDNDDKLRTSAYAKEAEYFDEQWRLKDIKQTIIEENKVSNRYLQEAVWTSLLNPGMLNFVTIKPQYLTLWGLFDYIRFLRANAQDTSLYEQALWVKLIKPFSIITMILLAIPLVHSNSRFTTVGQRVFLGALIGILFHLCNQVAGHLGIVYAIHPSISITMPTVTLLAVIFLFLWKQRV